MKPLQTFPRPINPRQTQRMQLAVQILAPNTRPGTTKSNPNQATIAAKQPWANIIWWWRPNICGIPWFPGPARNTRGPGGQGGQGGQWGQGAACGVRGEGLFIYMVLYRLSQSIKVPRYAIIVIVLTGKLQRAIIVARMAVAGRWRSGGGWPGSGRTLGASRKAPGKEGPCQRSLTFPPPPPGASSRSTTWPRSSWGWARAGACWPRWSPPPPSRRP